MKKKNLPKKYKFLRVFGKICLGILIFLILTILFIRSPWGQNIIVQKLTLYLENKTQTKVEVERVFITFTGNIFIEKLYLEDTHKDTLLYSEALEANIALLPLIKGEGFNLKKLYWNNAYANIYQQDSIKGFNYQFLIDAFATDSTAQKTVDTTSTFYIKLGALDFENIRLNYFDKVNGTDLKSKLGKLNLTMDNFDLDAMRFDVDELELRKSKIEFAQYKTTTTTDTTNATQLPFITLGNIQIEETTLNYNSTPDSLNAYAYLGNTNFRIPEIDLSNNKIEATELTLKNSKVKIELNKQKTNIQASKVPEESLGFQWPNYNINIDLIDFENNSISYLVNNSKPKKGSINPNAISLSNFAFKANHIRLQDQQAQFTIEKLTVQETSGISLQNFSVKGIINEHNVKLDDLNVSLNNNRISGSLNTQYSSLNSFISNPEKATFTLNIPQYHASLKDVFEFLPELKRNEYLKILSKKKLSGNLYAQGKLNDFKVQDGKVAWGNSTKVTFNTTIKNALDTDNLYFDINKFVANSNKQDITSFIQSDSLAYELPDKMQLEIQGKGTLDNLIANAKMSTTDGNIIIEGNYKNTGNIAFDATLDLDNIKLGKILKNKAVDTLNITLRTKGSGTSLNDLDATLTSEIRKLSYNVYDLTPLQLNGEINNGKGKVNAAFKDYNLNATMITTVILDSIASDFKTDINIIGADLYALKLTPKNIKSQLQFHANFKGNPDKFNANAAISDWVVVYENSPYYPGEIAIQAAVEKDSSAFDIHSKLFTLKARANTDINNISKALGRYYQNLTRADSVALDSINKPVNIYLNTRIYDTPFLKEVVLSGIERMDTIKFDIDFKEAKQTLFTNISVPYLRYGLSTIDGLELHIDANTNAPDFSFNLEKIDAGRVQIKKLSFTGQTVDKKLQMKFEAFDDNEKLVHINSTASKTKDTVFYHIQPDSLLINKRMWTTPTDNQVAISKEAVRFTNFNFTHKEQYLGFANNLAERIDKEHMGMDFKGFRLQTILSLLNPDEPLAKGVVNGKFIIVEPFGKTAFLAGLDVNNLEVLKAGLGNLSLRAAAIGNERYSLKLALKDGGIDLDMKGHYTAKEKTTDLNLQMDINKLELTTIEKFSNGAITDASGYLSGNLDISGTTAKPKFNGALGFHNTSLNMKLLDTPFKIDNEQISFSNSGIQFKTFTIKDVNNNTFVLDGNIITENPINPEFDLSLKAKNFQVLDVAKEDNDLFYGKANINATATIKGNLDIPVINAKLSANEGTDVYYVVPEATLDLEDRDGVVVFVNRKNPDAIITRNTTNTSAILKGFRLESLIQLNKNATFNVIIDEKTGDNLRVSGKGDLTFSIAENGRTSLSGQYRVTGGHYEMSLYNLVNRKFELAPESTVTWSGDPMDASLDVKAIYEVKTSAASLMASQSGSESAAMRNSYRQRLPFLVYLNVDGQLMRPKLSFALDIPEDERGISGGAIYGKIQSLNQTEDELNKQVFSLLVLNRFFPETGSYGDTGGTATIARDNLSQALTDQLNVASDKLLGNTGFQLQFDVDSYTDYQGTNTQERTDVEITAKKKLFNDRVTVNVGSEVNVLGDTRPGENNQVIGNVSIEYLLTEDGRFSIKGFRKNSYENIIDGQLIVSGISLIFTKEFNKFSELWKGTLKEEEEVIPEDEKDAKKTDDPKTDPDQSEPQNDKNEE